MSACVTVWLPAVAVTSEPLMLVVPPVTCEMSRFWMFNVTVSPAFAPIWTLVDLPPPTVLTAAEVLKAPVSNSVTPLNLAPDSELEICEVSCETSVCRLARSLSE